MTAPLNVPLIVNSGTPLVAQWPGGSGLLTGVAGTWNSNTVTLNFLGPDGATYIATTTTLTANGTTAFTLPQGTIKTTQSGSSTALYVNAQVIPTNLN